MPTMVKYTFTFAKEHEKKFRQILSRLDESEYTIIQDIEPVVPEDMEKSRTTIMEMDAESALTFRMGMKEVKIRRERTEEELAAEKERDERHTIRVTVVVDKDDV